MRKCVPPRDVAREEEGQALIEYVLLIAITISLVTLMATGLRKSVFGLWGFYTRAVAAPCPGCPGPSEVK
jgi:Flp pilus assembly pilin Flp